MEYHPKVIFNDRYVLKELLGRGSFGEVWLSYDKVACIDVALKIYIALDNRGLEDFRNEYRSVFGIQHPNVLTPTHFDVWSGCPYLVMQYCPVSCDSLIGQLTEEEIWKFVSDVSGGLAYLHGQDIIHRDIKPDNILRDSHGRYVLTDFGLSKRLRASLRRNSTRSHQEDLSGALSYMGPELFEAKPEAVKATDIWALGVTIYEMLLGDLPFMGQGGIMLKNGAEIPELPNTYSYGLRKLVHDCLQKNPWDRPTASQLLGYKGLRIQTNESGFKRVLKFACFITVITIILSPWIKGDVELIKQRKNASGVITNVIPFPSDTVSTQEEWSKPEQTAPVSVEITSTQSVENYRVLNSEGVLLYTYTGDLINGIPNGHGKASYPDGREYEGGFVNGKRNDETAKFVFSDGNVYEGSFVDDFIGSGRLTSKQQSSFGTYFVGSFKDDKPYKGTWFDKNGTKICDVYGQ